MESKVVEMWASHDVQEVITIVGGAQLTVQKLQSYAGTADGNDEVLNAFLHLLNTGEYAQGRRTHIFNSYFYTKLKDLGYGEVKKWTRAASEKRERPCLAELDSMIVPILHTEGRHHWALMQLHQELKAMRCLDSFATDKTEAVQVLAQYVRLERARSAGGGMAEVWEPEMTSVPIPRQDAAGNACGPRTAISAMYLMQQNPGKIDAAENAEIMAPQYERSMRIFVVHCVITGHIPRKFGSAGVSNETTEERESPDQEQGEQDPEQDLADEAFWDTGSEGSDLEATEPDESEEEEPETDQSGSESEASLTEEPGSPETETAGMRTPTAGSDEQSGIKTKRRPKRRLDSDSEASNCDDTSDEDAEDIVKELSQALEEAESEEERKSQRGRQDESKTDEGDEWAATADNSAPAARQSAQKVRAPAAGVGEANSDGEQDKRGEKRPREEQATGADAAAPSKAEAEGGLQKTKRQRKMPRKRKKSAAPGRRINPRGSRCAPQGPPTKVRGT